MREPPPSHRGTPPGGVVPQPLHGSRVTLTHEMTTSEAAMPPGTTAVSARWRPSAAESRRTSRPRPASTRPPSTPRLRASTHHGGEHRGADVRVPASGRTSYSWCFESSGEGHRKGVVGFKKTVQRRGYCEDRGRPARGHPQERFFAPSQGRPADGSRRGHHCRPGPSGRCGQRLPATGPSGRVTRRRPAVSARVSPRWASGGSRRGRRSG